MSDDKKDEGALPPSDEEKSVEKSVPEDKAPEGAPSKELVHELREENKKWRLRAKDNLSSVKSLEDRVLDAEKVSSQAMTLLKEQKKMTDTRLIDSEIKAVAARYGLTKNKYLDLADKSKVIINEAGEVEGAREMIESFKKDEPNFFELPSSGQMHKRPSTDSKTDAPPPIATMNKVDARKAIDDFIKADKRRRPI